MALPQVTWVFNRAVAQAMMTTVRIKTTTGNEESIEYELERSDYERLFNKFEHDRQRVLDYYTEQVAVFIEARINKTVEQ